MTSKNDSSAKASNMRAFLTGSASAICSTTVLQPFDFLKTRLQSPVTLGMTSPGAVKVIVDVLRKEKLSGFWQGLMPSLYRTVPGVGVYFSSLNLLCSSFGYKVGKPIPAMQSFAMGITARALSDICMLPLTVIKARYESGHFRYSSVWHAVATIHKTEGTKALFSGLSATLLRDAPYSGIYLMLYTKFKKVTESSMPTVHGKPVGNFLCGIAAGSVASFITQPPDVVKTHMQLYPHKFNNFFETLRHVYRSEGLAGFQRGLFPRLVRRTLMSAITWTAFELANK